MSEGPTFDVGRLITGTACDSLGTKSHNGRHMKIASRVCYIKAASCSRLTSANAVILFNECRAGRATTYSLVTNNLTP